MKEEIVYPAIIDGLGGWSRPSDIRIQLDKAYLGWDERQKAYFVISGYYMNTAMKDKQYQKTVESSWVVELP
jgi:hypothetical protein